MDPENIINSANDEFLSFLAAIFYKYYKNGTWFLPKETNQYFFSLFSVEAFMIE